MPEYEKRMVTAKTITLTKSRAFFHQACNRQKINIYIRNAKKNKTNNRKVANSIWTGSKSVLCKCKKSLKKTEAPILASLYPIWPKKCYHFQKKTKERIIREVKNFLWLEDLGYSTGYPSKIILTLLLNV